jgi:hypothetical protein
VRRLIHQLHIAIGAARETRTVLSIALWAKHSARSLPQYAEKVRIGPVR